MLRRTALPLLICLSLSLDLAAGAALAFEGDAGASQDDGSLRDAAEDRWENGSDSDSRLAQEDGDYTDIMDDVDAVIDAMDEAMGGDADLSGNEPPHDFATQSSTSRSGPPSIPEGPRTPSPIVVELFTAQGCDACPPAGELLGNLQGRPDVLVLSWHVDYWDYLGWADSFAKPEFSARQKGYNLSRGARTLFTPQMIVAGETAIDNPNPAALMSAVKHERAEGDHVAIARSSEGARSEIELSPLTSLPSDIAVQLVRYLPGRSVEVGSGENAGKNLKMYNVVASVDELARWDGTAPLRITVTLGAGNAGKLPADTRHAVIVQQMRGPRPGEIFATILLD